MEEKERAKVCAVIVTHNRKQLLIECLRAIIRQTRSVDGIYIIDNCSTDGTSELLYKEGYIKELHPYVVNEPWEKEFTIHNLNKEKVTKIHYVRMHKNTGGAGGFYEGVKRAYEKGYDWLWLMDDDVFPKIDCLQKLFDIGKELDQNFYLFQPIRYYQQDFFPTGCDKLNFKNPFRGHADKIVNIRKLNRSKIKFRVIEGVCFEGILINRYAINLIGYPNGDFFLGGDETDYSMRLLNAGFKTILVKDAIMYRLLPPKKKSNLKGEWWYYLIRNTVALDRIWGNRLVKIVRPWIRLFRTLLLHLIYRRKFNEIFVIFLGFKDGWNITLGERGIL